MKWYDYFRIKIKEVRLECVVMIKCVCLVVEEDDELLLVQARNREKYYFPGGKIDDGETYKQALQRELKEELQVDVPEISLVYIR